MKIVLEMSGQNHKLGVGIVNCVCEEKTHKKKGNKTE